MNDLVAKTMIHTYLARYTSNTHYSIRQLTRRHYTVTARESLSGRRSYIRRLTIFEHDVNTTSRDTFHCFSLSNRIAGTYRRYIISIIFNDLFYDSRVDYVEQSSSRIPISNKKSSFVDMNHRFFFPHNTDTAHHLRVTATHASHIIYIIESHIRSRSNCLAWRISNVQIIFVFDCATIRVRICV